MLERSIDSICYFDITACYPNLLPYWAEDIGEKNRLVEVLKNDFYAVLAAHSKSNHSRDDLKRIVSRFLCHPEKPFLKLPIKQRLLVIKKQLDRLEQFTELLQRISK